MCTLLLPPGVNPIAVKKNIVYVLTHIAGRLNISNIQDLINCLKIRGNYAYRILYYEKPLHFIHIMSVLSDFQK
jgi:hypothetical protein